MRYFRTAGTLWSSPEHEPFARHDCEIVVPMNKMFFLQAAASLDDRSNLLCFGQDDWWPVGAGDGGREDKLDGEEREASNIFKAIVDRN